MPNTRIQLRRYPGHWREGLLYFLGVNVAVALGAVGVDLVLPDSTPLPVRVAVIGALVVLVVVAAVQRRRRRLSAVAASIDVSPNHLLLTLGGGSPKSVTVASLTVRRLAYLRDQGSAVDHAPVLEFRVPQGPTLRVVGLGARAWPQFDADLSAAPQYAVDASDWDTLSELLGVGGEPR